MHLSRSKQLGVFFDHPAFFGSRPEVVRSGVAAGHPCCWPKPSAKSRQDRAHRGCHARMSFSNRSDEKLSFVEAPALHQISGGPLIGRHTRDADQIRRAHMKTLLLAVTALVFAATANVSPAAAATLFAPTPTRTATGTPHYEWQYHHGNKARCERSWALVR